MKLFMKKILLAAVVLPLTFSIAHAKNGQGGNAHKMPLKEMLQQLDLTEKQELEVKTIMKSYRTEMKKGNVKGAFHDANMEIMKADKFDDDKAQSLIDAMFAQKKAKKLKKMQMKHEIYHSLTVEQQAKLDLLFQQKYEEMKNKAKGKNKKDKN